MRIPVESNQAATSSSSPTPRHAEPPAPRPTIDWHRGERPPEIPARNDGYSCCVRCQRRAFSPSRHRDHGRARIATALPEKATRWGSTDQKSGGSIHLPLLNVRQFDGHKNVASAASGQGPTPSPFSPSSAPAACSPFEQRAKMRHQSIRASLPAISFARASQRLLILAEQNFQKQRSRGFKGSASLESSGLIDQPY